MTHLQLDYRVDRYILYPNQYITVEQSGNFTRHYYSRSEKIASSLGTGISFGTGNGTYRTQFETNLKGVFAESNNDEPEFFINAAPAPSMESLCAEFLYSLKQKFKLE